LGPGEPVDHIPKPSVCSFFLEAVMLPFFILEAIYATLRRRKYPLRAIIITIDLFWIFYFNFIEVLKKIPYRIIDI
jgi:hypothetical protein